MLTFQLTPVPDITTDRLVLRQIHHGDASEILYLRGHPSLMHFIPRPRAASIEDAKELIDRFLKLAEQNEAINWGITLKGEDKVIGVIGYVKLNAAAHRAEVGYMLHDGYHGKGIIREALAAVLHHGFETYRLHSVEAIIDPVNVASEKVLNHAGFVKEGFFREAQYFEGQYLDISVYTLLTPFRNKQDNGK
ncbi:GNAT family N-acetyltransferase [Chitinophaga deserti]|uniref:GNAT family N-acetyltransferase n=1 Tax=Chitinophaga deserti TaxID=2164099 RepID=UPI000D6BA33A|nr:GNAT family N-acetyltransferase [Chitinophaga deserti]